MEAEAADSVVGAVVVLAAEEEEIGGEEAEGEEEEDEVADEGDLVEPRRASWRDKAKKSPSIEILMWMCESRV